MLTEAHSRNRDARMLPLKAEILLFCPDWVGLERKEIHRSWAQRIESEVGEGHLTWCCGNRERLVVSECFTKKKRKKRGGGVLEFVPVQNCVAQQSHRRGHLGSVVWRS